MHTLSIRAAAVLAYDRGEEFDAGAMPAPGLLDALSMAASASAIVPEPGPVERRRHRRRETREAHRRVPEWFAASDLVAPLVPGVDGRVVGGEPV